MAGSAATRTLSYKSPHLFFFLNDTATTEIYTLSLHDALPIWLGTRHPGNVRLVSTWCQSVPTQDRKSTRLNSSHRNISYAVFCLKKKTQRRTRITTITSLTHCARTLHSVSNI